MKKQSKTAQIRALLEAGKSVKEVAAKLKVKPAAVYQVRYQTAKAKEQIGEFAEKYISRDFKPGKPRALRNTPPADKGPSFDQVFTEIGENARKLGTIIMGGTDIKPEDIKPAYDPVNHPRHYTTGKIETIDYIDAKGFNYCLGNAIKYVSRAPHKGKYVEDLKKAIWYINHAIKLHEEGRG